jgi:MFS family permease
MKKKKTFFGWWIVAASVVVLGLTWTLPVSFFGLFIKPVTSDLGFDRAGFSVCSTIVALTAVFMSPFVGRWMSKYSSRLIMGCSVLFIIVGFLGYSISTSLPMFYIFAFSIGLGLNGAAIMAVSIIMKNWFIEKRGLATSIALAGTGLGGFLLSPVVNMLILDYGWRIAYRGMAGILVVIVLPLVIFIIKKSPEEMGLEPYGTGQQTDTGGSKAKAAELEIPLAQLKGKSIFWIYMICIAFVGFAGGAVLFQAPAYLVDIGHTPTVVANAVAMYLGIATFGKILLGNVFDVKGAVAGVLLGCGLMAVCTVVLVFAQSSIMLWLFVALHGIGTCCGTVTPPVLTSKTFGSKYYGEIYGMTNLFLQFGMAIGAPLVATYYDKMGSYVGAWYVCAFMMVLAVAGLIYTNVAARRLIPKNEACAE